MIIGEVALMFGISWPTVIKLFESKNVLKCENRPHDFIETLHLFSNY